MSNSFHKLKNKIETDVLLKMKGYIDKIDSIRYVLVSIYISIDLYFFFFLKRIIRPTYVFESVGEQIKRNTTVTALAIPIK